VRVRLVADCTQHRALLERAAPPRIPSGLRGDLAGSAASQSGAAGAGIRMRGPEQGRAETGLLGRDWDAWVRAGERIPPRTPTETNGKIGCGSLPIKSIKQIKITANKMGTLTYNTSCGVR
jgi:hypothetical protein